MMEWRYSWQFPLSEGDLIVNGDELVAHGHRAIGLSGAARDEALDHDRVSGRRSVVAAREREWMRGDGWERWNG